jgi:uncharacterized membrane protein
MAEMNKATSYFTLERLNAFVDGVFAIVITILVLDIDVPESNNLSSIGVLEFLKKIEFQLVPYIASFFLTASYWTLHHLMLNFISECNYRFIWLNALFLLPVTLTPFMAKVRVAYPNEISTAILFGVVQLTIYLLLLGIWHYGLRFLTTSPVSPATVRRLDKRVMIAIALIVIGVLLMPISERAATLAFICTPFAFVRHNAGDKPVPDKKSPPIG